MQFKKIIYKIFLILQNLFGKLICICYYYCLKYKAVGDYYMIKKWNIKMSLPLMGITAMFLAFFTVPSTVAAQGNSVVYVSTTKGANTSSGSGTKTDPYNLFNDAVKGVADGGTIYILAGSNSAILNDLNSSNEPFVINKQIYIKPEPGAQTATLTTRVAGIILGADVTFENIELNVTNRYHDQIFANGHTLTLNNVTRAQGSRLVDIVAGGLYSNNTQISTATPGNNGKIIIQGKCAFGNIYAGSINGNFSGTSSIDIGNIAANSLLGNIYSCGADETPIGDDFFNQEEPPAPTPNPHAYKVTGKVNVTINKAPVQTIDGTGAGNGTDVFCNAEYASSYHSFLNITKLTVGGKLRPKALTAPEGKRPDLSVPSNGILNLTDLKNIEVKDFIGGGRLLIDKSSTLSIFGTATGTSVFETEYYKGQNSHSGIVTINHVYIKAGSTSSATFTFDPYPTQTDLILQRQANGDWMIIRYSSSSAVTFTYESADDFMGDVDRSTETIDSANGTPLGAEAIPYDGYRFVNWTKDGVVVSTNLYLVPQKTGTAYSGGHYIAHFAEDNSPEPEQPEKPDPDDTDSGNTSPGTPPPPAPPAAPKPSAPTVTDPMPVNVSLSKPKVTLKRGKKYAVIKYKKVKNAHGYEIYRSNKKKSGYKKVATTKKTSYKNKKLKSRKKYYYKVRAYRTVNGQKYYSSYSAVKSVKVK